MEGSLGLDSNESCQEANPKYLKKSNSRRKMTPILRVLEGLDFSRSEKIRKKKTRLITICRWIV